MRSFPFVNISNKSFSYKYGIGWTIFDTLAARHTFERLYIFFLHKHCQFGTVAHAHEAADTYAFVYPDNTVLIPCYSFNRADIYAFPALGAGGDCSVPVFILSNSYTGLKRIIFLEPCIGACAFTSMTLYTELGFFTQNLHNHITSQNNKIIYTIYNIISNKRLY